MNRFQIFSIALMMVTSLAFGEEPSFNRQVRPILSDKCYFCHGPDSGNQKAGLRLDSFDEAKDVIESGYLIEKIFAEDPDEIMPPPDSHLSLTDQEKEIIKRWIESGAKYENHWAFEPLPEKIEVPTSKTDKWSKSELDRFVWDSLDKQDELTSVESEPLRWFRRVSFDLTGLPPTVDEIDSFLDDLNSNDKEAVYSKEVDRLLASTAYGEHMAVAWLDAARYADSYGYQSDILNSQWPYRDWVVRAFNDNLPYDDFITWQLAGDLLENPTRDQRLATAFNRIHRLNNEGGAVFEEWRIENVADRVQTFGTAVLGLTLECCRCHDHKYDPIPMRDYYAMSAFFNSIDENGVYDVGQKIPVPSLLLPTAEQEKSLNDLRKAMQLAEASYYDRVTKAKRRFQNSNSSLSNEPGIPDTIRSVSFDVPYDQKFKENNIYYFGTADAYNAKPLEFSDTEDISIPAMKQDQAADSSMAVQINESSNPVRRSVKLDGERGIVLPEIEPFDRWTPFSIVLTLKESKRVALPAVIAQASFGQLTFNGWDLMADNGHLEFRIYRVWPGNMIAVRTKKKIPLDKWCQVAACYDGSSDAHNLKIFLDGVELETEVVRNRIKKRASVKGHHGGKLTIGQRFRDRGLADWFIDDVRVIGRVLTQTELNHLFNGNQIEVTEEYYVHVIDEEVRIALKELTSARQRYVMAEEAIHEIPVMEEMSSPRETHVLARGEYDAPTSDETQVQRNVFTDFGPEFPTDSPLDRLGLAHWATSPNHPLTARVIVNRLWGNFFGYGLVRTPENFGLQGELPTHPELLDWLARDFVDNGWDIKRFCRNVVLSATYRQDSKTSERLLSIDPENRLLARGPSNRLSSEQIRDLALSSSGLLNNQIGGPPVSPYQAGGDLWRESNSMSPAYKQSVGKDLYRRSIYSVWKRTAPLPNMLAFDAESREVCIVKRARTNTPLQALVLMNDQQFVESSRVLAENSILQNDGLAKRLNWAFQSLSGRKPDDRETSILTDLFQSELEYYDSEPSAATELINSGESKPNLSLNPIELAAMTVVCQAILNLDASIWKR